MILSAWKMCKQIPVIYGIHNLITNKWYIGSCNDFRDRLHRHYYCLKHNKHHSVKLQNSWNKYGEDAFIAVILVELQDNNISDMFTIEENFIKLFNSKDNGYNILDTCREKPTFTLSKEASKKAGATHAKSIIALDRFTGKVLQKFSSITEAGNTFKESTSNISQVCKHKLRYCKNTVFVYADEYNPSVDYSVPFHHMKGVAKTDEWKIKARLSNKRSKKVYVYKDNNLIYTYNSRSEAERAFNFKKEFLRTRLDKPIDGYIFTHKIKDIV